jgi:tol-pal system protein YbgF
MFRSLVLVLLGCAFSAQALALFDDDEARRRIELLRQQVEATQRSIDERLSKIEQLTGDRSALLEFSAQMEALRTDVANMRGQLEVLVNQAENADKRQKDLYLDIDMRLRTLEQTREQAAVPERAPAAAEPEVSAAEARAYQAALDQFKLGNYSLAVAAMQGFLVTYPASPLAPNAQYWIGMAYSGQRDYKSAIAAQRKLLASWPESQKAPDACFPRYARNHGRRKAAQKTLEDLVGTRPAARPERSSASPRSPGVDRKPASLALVIGGAFVLAFIFGAVGNRTHFCAVGAGSDGVNMGDLSRMRMWLLAIAVALIGSSALQLAGVIDLSKSIYPGPNFTWLSYLVGGFLFGVGMTLGSGCGSKTLIRIGAGNLKSVIVYVFLGIAAYMTLKGLLGAFALSCCKRPRSLSRRGRISPSFWLQLPIQVNRCGTRSLQP